ncbi:MAG: ABC transporter permease [Bacteroidetes bacterium]|nr:ABC transporter permease [Bacteroidota bacterium]
MSFIVSVRAESIKVKRSLAFWLSILGAGFIPVIFLLMYYFRSDVFVLKLAKDPWRNHILHGWQALSAFLLPMFIILTCSLVTQIEFKNNTWKQVYSSPQTIGNIFFSKLFVIHCMILFCFLLFNIFLLGSGLLTNLLNRNYSFFSSPVDWEIVLRMNFKSYISILGISAIQYWLSLRFKNFIASIGIGLALLITALIIMEWEQIYKVPYAFPLLTFDAIFKRRPLLIENHEWNSIVYFLAFTLLAFFDTKFRKERG